MSNSKISPISLPMDTSDLTNSRIGEAVEVMKALSNETRLKILCALLDGEKSVNQLAEYTNQLLPSVSQHLSKMRAADLVASRREAQTIYYRATEGIGHTVVEALCKFYKA